MGSRIARAGLLAVSLGALAQAGCAAASQNVRAYRAFAMEDTSIKVAFDRIEDIARSMELVDKILSGTSYTPGDFWARRIALSDRDAKEIKAQIAKDYPYNTGDFEVPILKVYRVYLERTLEEYRPPPEKAMYPSLVDAVGALTPGGRTLKTDWDLYKTATAGLSDAAEGETKLRDEIAALSNENQRRARDPEFQAARLKTSRAAAQVDAAHKAIQRDMQNMATDVTLTTGERERIARDAFSALSVAFRIELEALAMIPIATIGVVRSLPSAPRNLTVHPNLKIAKQAWELPMYLVGTEERLKRETAAMEYMVGILSKALKTEVSDSPGMALRESIVDQIVGITIDSFRLDLHAGGEAFLFNAIPTGDKSSSSDGKTTYDYTGRQNKLTYSINPIILASARLDLTMDWIRLPGVANLGFGYSTDRVYNSGGTITNTSLAQALGINSTVSDVIDAGLGLLGARSSVRVASWTAGQVQRTSATTGQVLDSAPLRLTQTQVDVGYDILFAIDQPGLEAWMEELVIGGRYLQYKLPRILYELQDTSAVAGEQHFTFSRESPPQIVESDYWMLGISTRLGQGEAPRFSPYLDLGIYGGGGPSAFYFLHNQTQPDVPSNRDLYVDPAWVVDGSGALGLRVRLLPRGSFLRLDIRALYKADFIYATISRSAQSNGRGVTTDFGGVDVFHGPAIALRGSL